ncbi:MAG: hypothetical protein ACLF0G_04350 [Candidatus Brocadiia bacterium]
MAKSKKKSKKKKAPKDTLVVGTKVRAYIRGKKAMMSGELLEALNDMVTCALDKAIERAKANKRATVKPQDL